MEWSINISVIIKRPTYGNSENNSQKYFHLSLHAAISISKSFLKYKFTIRKSSDCARISIGVFGRLRHPKDSPGCTQPNSFGSSRRYRKKLSSVDVLHLTDSVAKGRARVNRIFFCDIFNDLSFSFEWAILICVNLKFSQAWLHITRLSFVWTNHSEKEKNKKSATLSRISEKFYQNHRRTFPKNWLYDKKSLKPYFD